MFRCSFCVVLILLLLYIILLSFDKNKYFLLKITSMDLFTYHNEVRNKILLSKKNNNYFTPPDVRKKTGVIAGLFCMNQPTVRRQHCPPPTTLTLTSLHNVSFVNLCPVLSELLICSFYC